MTVTIPQVRDILKKIYDPEIYISIVDLGLIYGIGVEPSGDRKKAKVTVRLTLTTPACPYGPALLSKVHADISEMPEVEDVNVDLVWIPQWNPRTMASDEAKMQMGIFELDGGEDELEENPEPWAAG